MVSLVIRFAFSTPRWMKLIVILPVFLLSGIYANAGQGEHIIITISPNSQFQLDTAAAIRKNLEAIDIRASIISTENINASPAYANTAYILIGNAAASAYKAHEVDAPVLFISNKKLQDTRFTSAKANLVLEQPVCRDVPLIKAMDQDWESIAFLSSINSIERASDLTRCAIEYGFDIQVYAITNDTDLLKTLEMAIEDNDVLLAVADPLIYNSRTVKNILLTSYRRRKPVIGYSDNFVDAGAIAAVYTSANSAGERAAQIISDFIDNNWQFKSKVYYPTDFSVRTNYQVAKSLGISLPDDETLHNKIMVMEHK